MELRHLRYLLAVVEEGTVTAAAARLHVAQPGVSAQLRQLERELGEPLLTRTARGVRPTAAGEAVLPHARAALAAVEGARQAVDALRGLVRGRVTVGMAAAQTASALPDQLAGFREAHPGVDVSLVSGSSDELVARLRRGDLDVAYVGVGAATPGGLDSVVVSDQPMVVVTGPDDPLAGRAEVALTELRDRDTLGMAAGSGLRAVLDAACAGAGFRLRVTFEAADPLLLARLAARGLGVAVVPASALAAAGVDTPPAALVPPLHARIELAWASGGPASPAARALVAYLRATR